MDNEYDFNSLTDYSKPIALFLIIKAINVASILHE